MTASCPALIGDNAMRKNLYEYALPVTRLQPMLPDAANDVSRFTSLRLDLPTHVAENRAGLLLLHPDRMFRGVAATSAALSIRAERAKKERAASYPVTLRYNFADFLARCKQPELESGERYDTLYQPAEVAAALFPRMSQR